MATSGVYVFVENRNSIIKDAYIAIGQIDHDMAMNASMVQLAARKLDRILADWRKQGLLLWKRVDCSLILEPSKRVYSLGPSGDHWATSYVRTTVDGDYAAAATTLDFASTDGMTAGDVLLLELASGSFEETTITSVDTATTLTIPAISGAIDDGAYAFAYTSKAQRPLRILGANNQNPSEYRTPVTIWPKDRYERLGQSYEGDTVTVAAFTPTITNATFEVYPTPKEVRNTVEMVVEYPIQVYTDMDDEGEMPVEAYNALLYELASLLAIDFKTDNMTYSRVRTEAALRFQSLLDWSVEDTEIQLEPEGYDY